MDATSHTHGRIYQARVFTLAEPPTSCPALSMSVSTVLDLHMPS